MEVGRRALDADNEFRKRTMRKKKLGSLPLAMFISLNDKDVHPECPNASNPYHKCGRHCLGKIPSGNNFLDALRSEGDRELEKKPVKKGVNPNCPHASNPFHKCAEYCFEKLSEKPQDAGKDQPGMSPKEENKAVFTPERGVKYVCKNASDPYHVCAEYCFQNVPKKEQPGQVMKRDSKEGTRVLSNKERTRFIPHCKHASNPHHECSKSCFQSVSDRNLAKEEKPSGVSNKTKKSSVHLKRSASSPYDEVTEYCNEDIAKNEHPKGDMKPLKENEIDVTPQQGFKFECKNALNPYHVCAEYCFQSVPDREQNGQVIRPKSSKKGEKVLSNIVRTAIKLIEESEIVHTAEQRVKLQCKNASNPYHVCAEYCFETIPERKSQLRFIRLKSLKDGVKELKNRRKTGLDPWCKYASNPHHECTEFCFQNVADRNLTEEEMPKGVSLEIDKGSALPNSIHASSLQEKELSYGAMKPKEENIVAMAQREVKLECQNVSNPNHVCAENSFQNLPVKDQRGEALKKSKEDKKVVVPLESEVNPHCKNASNPYHLCAEYCFENVPKGQYAGRAMMKSKEEKKTVVSSQKVNSDCKLASNPYHVCAEYCLENAIERDQPRKTMKKSNEEEIVVPPLEGGVITLCKFASNPYHACTEYCFQNFIEREQHGKVMKPKSSKELKNSVSNKKITSGQPQRKYASNPYHECAEYCSSNIPAGVMKTNERKKEISFALRRGVNPKCKNASNPYHRCDEYCSEGIILPKEPIDVQPLHIDASDLFHEWGKYCSQTKPAEDEIVFMQEKIVGMVEFSATNEKGNVFLKENKEKVEATTTGGSLLISLLFFIRFLLAPLYWTQVIYYLVISSEKNEGPERMRHKGHM